MAAPEYLDVVLHAVNASNVAGVAHWINTTGTKWKVESAKLVANTTISADDTNYRTFRLAKGTAAASYTNLGAGRATTNAGGALTTGVTETYELTATGSDLELAAGETLRLDSAEAGTGPLADVVMVVHLVPMAPAS